MRRDWMAFEIPALVLVLVGGGALRVWLSTAIPFDDSELDILMGSRASEHGIRVPFIMFNGISLLAVYLLVRRSAGVGAAIAMLLLLQTSLTFQEHALRIRFAVPLVTLGLGLVASWRYTHPPGRWPSAVTVGLLVFAVLLGVRGIYLGITLPKQLASIRRASAAEAEPLWTSLRACGGDLATPLERLRTCSLAWPPTRSLAQQETLLAHRMRLEDGVRVLDGRAPVSEPIEGRVAVFDRAGVAFLVVEAGPAVDTALRVVGASASGGRLLAP